MDHSSGSATVEGAAFFPMLLSCCDRPLHWGGRSGQWFFGRNAAAMSCCCLAANDKATTQKQMTTEPQIWCEVYGRQTWSCQQVSLLQLFNPTISLGFYFINYWVNIKPFFLQCSVGKGKDDQDVDNQAVLAPSPEISKIACHTGLLQHHLTLFQNDKTEDKRWEKVNTSRKNHTSPSLVSDIKEKCHKKNLPRVTI